MIFQFLQMKYLITNAFGFASVVLFFCHGIPFLMAVEFRSIPDDQTVREGDSTGFMCVLQTSTSENVTNASTFWEDGMTREVSSSVSDSSTSIEVTLGIIRSDLVLRNVRRDIDGFYIRCTILLHFADGRREVLSSKFWMLRVLYFPTRSDMYCQEPDSLEVLEGDTIRLECISRQGNPPVDLHIEGTHAIHLANFTSESSKHRVSINGTITVSKYMQANNILCVATSQAFPDRNMTCSFGSFNVLYPPEVIVTPKYGILFPPAVAMTTLSCFSEGNPSLFTYHWSCHPPEAVSNFVAAGQNLTLSVMDTKPHDFFLLEVTCEAKNNIGSSNATAIINVTYIHHDLIPECGNISSGTIIDQGLQLLPDIQDNDDILRCLMVTDVLSPFLFRWYLDGHLAAERKGIFDIEELQGGSQQLLVYSEQEVQRAGIVACELAAPSTGMTRQSFCSFRPIVREWSSTPQIREDSMPGTIDVTTGISGRTQSGMKDQSKSKNGANVDSRNEYCISLSTFWIMLITLIVLVLLLVGIVLIMIISRKTRGCRYTKQNNSGSLEFTRSRCQSITLDGVSYTPHRDPGHVDPIYELPDDDRPGGVYETRIRYSQRRTYIYDKKRSLEDQNGLDEMINVKLGTTGNEYAFIPIGATDATDDCVKGVGVSIADFDKGKSDKSMLHYHNLPVAKSPEGLPGVILSDESVDMSYEQGMIQFLNHAHSSSDGTSSSTSSCDEIRHIYFGNDTSF